MVKGRTEKRMDLKDKNIIITGSADRIGKAIALGLAKEGAHVAIHYHDSKKNATHTIKEITQAGGKAYAFKADFNHIDQIKRLIDNAKKALGSIDVLINCASLFYLTPISSIKESQWDNIMNINLKAAFFCSKYAGKYMLEQGKGKIITISDIGAIKPWKFYSSYCISKAGLIAMTKVLAKEFAPSISVNAIAPGNILPGKNLSSSMVATLKSKALLDRIGSPHEIIECIKFILKSEFVTGSIFTIDGGQLLKT